jgi:hypothetical protein
LQNGEFFNLGRLKDMIIIRGIIIRGANFGPQDM